MEVHYESAVDLFEETSLAAPELDFRPPRTARDDA